MKNTYRVILMGLAVLGVVYASKGPEKKTKEEKYKLIDLRISPVSMEVGHFVQLKECHKRNIELKQVTCKSIGRDSRGDFPCYKGCDVIEVRTNFPAILNASLNKNSGNEDMLKDFNLYWENGVNTIQGTGDWEKLKLCLEAWDVEMWKYGRTAGTIKVDEITIGVPPDDTQLEDFVAIGH